jgi:6-phosphogluconolactonase
VADLGLDKVLVYKLDANRGKLTPNDEPWVRVKAGAGPRHFDFHPNGVFAYVINELDSTLTAFAYDAAAGTLAEIETVSTLPGGFEGQSHCADVHVSPSGRFVYGSNRGHDSIVVFAIDGDTGRLDYAGHEPTQGRTPRNFAIDPTGTFLLAANQDSDTVVTFRIDERTGLLEPTGHVTEVPMPVCLKLVSL